MPVLTMTVFRFIFWTIAALTLSSCGIGTTQPQPQNPTPDKADYATYMVVMPDIACPNTWRKRALVRADVVHKNMKYCYYK